MAHPKFDTLDVIGRQDNNLFPPVSVIVPCRNEEQLIAACLDSILNNEYPGDRVEILVVDGMSCDYTRTIVQQYATQHHHLQLLDNVTGTIPAAMNLGIKASRGDVILKMDAHSTYPADYIALCVRYLLTYQADMTGGVWCIASRGTSLTARAIALALSHPFASGNAAIKTGLHKPRWADAAAFGCWRRETLINLGLFDERLTRNSDMDLNNRLRARGGKILLAPDIRITYYADADLRTFWRHNFKDGMWTTYPLRFAKNATAWRHWVPFLFVMSLLLTFVTSLAYRPAMAVFASIGLVYGLVTMCVVIRIGIQKKDWWYLFLLPLAFLVRHLAHGLGATYGVVKLVLPMRPSAR
jgi:glycosyltransferase involved in cell wall biosynthesis